MTHLLHDVGYQAVAVGSVEQAWEILAQYVPDVILLDMVLVGQSGLTFLEKIKNIDKFCDIPVLVVSGVTELETKVSCINLGADDYLVKPVKSAELLARLRASLRRSKSHLRLKESVDQLLTDNVTDCLTGVRNRHYLDADLEYRLASLARNPERNFSIIMVDVDNFKGINDRFGHMSGDVVLRGIAREMQECVRAADIVARYGGEEFCILLPDCDAEGAWQLAERARAMVAAERFEGLGGESVTISCGVAQWQVSDQLASDLLIRADRALYQAKANGRNRVSLAEPLRQTGTVQ